MLQGRNLCDPINGCNTFYNQHLIKCPTCGTHNAFSDFVPYNSRHWIYDLECYPNVFTAAFKHVATAREMFFEISERKNQAEDLYIFLQILQQKDYNLIGFNNMGYDYPMLHWFINHYPQYNTAAELYRKSAAIIATPWRDRFSNVIWPNQIKIKQIDLSLILNTNFENETKILSLKKLEFNMRSNNIQDLPYKPGTVLTFDQISTLAKYNKHDVNETEKFYFKTLPLIEFREKLNQEYSLDFTNFNDIKIGREYFIMMLEQSQPGLCYTRDINNKRQPRQTLRDTIYVTNIIFDYIFFKEPAFERIRQWFASQTLTYIKHQVTQIDDFSAIIHDFKYVMGLGGIHGSIESNIIRSDNDYVLYDWDVKSYYPNLAIINKLYPEHLSLLFCAIYKTLFDKRCTYQSGTPENKMLKFALVGVFGNSKNIFSPFYDPQYTMSITINGQLLLLMLIQNLTNIPGLKMIQVNTDGVTVLCPRKQIDVMTTICKSWEAYTCLELESIIYKSMFIRDVNNYIAVPQKGDIKRVGAYKYNLDWHQNHSQLIVPKAAEAALVYGQDIASFIKNHNDIMDFMLVVKVGRHEFLNFEQEGLEVESLQKTSRYYISTNGGALFKISPPIGDHFVGQWKRASQLTDQFYQSVIAELKNQAHTQNLDVTGLPWDNRINTKNRSQYKTRRTGVSVGWLAQPCNDIRYASFDNINYDYYIEETKKLVDPLN